MLNSASFCCPGQIDQLSCCIKVLVYKTLYSITNEFVVVSDLFSFIKNNQIKDKMLKSIRLNNNLI